MSKATIGTLADHERTVRTPPRFAIRTFWLPAPSVVPVQRWPARPHSAGDRRAVRDDAPQDARAALGETRAAIIGCYEDGPNLVTLAMNGWGRAEPAWWLNLQANPDATVDLADGPRAM
jgi:hypothetical protein